MSSSIKKLFKPLPIAVVILSISLASYYNNTMSLNAIKARNLANANGMGKRAIVFGATQGSIGSGMLYMCV